MNSWKLNSTAGHLLRLAISKSLNIHFTEVYKTVKFIHHDGNRMYKFKRKVKNPMKHLTPKKKKRK